MCIALWALDRQDYALIIASNRDEFLERPTLPADFHNFEKEPSDSKSASVLSGRDIQAGGTWFGVNRAGRVALLTNITEAALFKGSSRGYLTSSFLLSDSHNPLEDLVGKIVPRDAKFAGFNLLLFAPVSLPSDESSETGAAAPMPVDLHYDARFVTNHGAGGELSSRPLSAHERSCGGVSNAVDKGAVTDEQSMWPKLHHATQEFDKLLTGLTPDTTDSELTDRLFHLLAWRSPEPVTHRSDLRNTVHVTPIPITLDGLRNTESNLYGTRLSTVLLIKRNGEALFVERDIWRLQPDTGAQTEKDIPSASASLSSQMHSGESHAPQAQVRSPSEHRVDVQERKGPHQQHHGASSGMETGKGKATYNEAVEPASPTRAVLLDPGSSQRVFRFQVGSVPAS